MYKIYECCVCTPRDFSNGFSGRLSNAFVSSHFFSATAESDLTTFSLKTEHFKSKQVETKGLLSADNRPAWVKRLYDQAGVPSKVYVNKPHVHRLSRRKRSLDDSCLPNDIELRKVRTLRLLLIYS